MNDSERVTYWWNRARAAEESIKRAREIHSLQYFRSIDEDGNADTYCDACSVGPYPCETIRALGGSDV